MPYKASKAQEEKDFPFLPGESLANRDTVTTQPMKTHYTLNSQILQWGSCLLQPSQLSFALLKKFSSPLLYWDSRL